MPLSTKVILSHHDYDETPSDEILEALAKEMFKGGADIAKIATTAQRIEDSARMLALPRRSSGVQIIMFLAPLVAQLALHILLSSSSGSVIPIR